MFEVSEVFKPKVEGPNARKLVESQFLGFLQMGYPNKQEDMDDILSAFRKIIYNFDELEGFVPPKQKLMIGR